MTPYNHHDTEYNDNPGFPGRILIAFSIPSTSSTRHKTLMVFSIFYTVVVTTPFVVSIIYWFILGALNSSFDSLTMLHVPSAMARDLVQEKDSVSMGITVIREKVLRTFVSLNIHTLNSVIALLEILVLSSVHKQKVGMRKTVL